MSKNPLEEYFDINLVEDSFALVADQAETLVDRFYTRLFDEHPEVQPLFANTTPQGQRRKLVGALAAVVKGLHDPDGLVKTLQEMGRRHEAYGALPDHYPVVAQILIEEMKALAGDSWTPEIEHAWTSAFNLIASTMLGAYERTENQAMTDSQNSSQANDNLELVRLRSAMENTLTAIMMVDRDLVVTYINQGTRELLQRHEAALASLFRGFSVEKIVGSCIDMFHKNPKHQRDLLANPANLPFSTDINVGDLIFNINVTAQIDDHGDYIGCTLEWYDVTEQRAREAENRDFAGKFDAISRSQALIEFEMDGTIITANDNFLAAIGYSLDEIKGKHHSMFVDNAYANSPDYRAFWDRLNHGDFDAGEYKRIAKGGREIWIQASYNPVLDQNGKPLKVIKYATDVTEQKLRNADYAGQIEAIGKSQAVIEFNMDGTIVHANENFCATMGYSLNEIRGQHHSMFADAAYAASPEYKAFWAKLNRGEYDAAEYLRYGKGGKEVWIQASYNPILDMNGEPFKVVKYATDVTERKTALNRCGQVMQAMAEGDLSQNMDGQYSGEFAELQGAVNGTIDQLRDMVEKIRNSALSINSAASEVSKGNTELSARTEEQASSLEETAASMEEMTSTVQQNADNSRQADQLASSARDQAAQGGEVVGRAVAAMSEINESSKKIADIIGVIDEIAFQTNLLALNAAVEAARAGEQGRGFAVVASEVRNLAQRSASAAKEIKALINDSVQKVTEGSKLVDESGATLAEIVNSVKKVSDIIGEIAVASEEQSSGISQVNQAVTQMDQMTQQNAALVEEAAAASESMDEESRSLLELMQFFNTGEGMTLSAAPANSRPAVERRSADRPWSEQNQASKPAAPRAAKPAAKAAAGGDVWEEF
ncbi:MAG: PAS domain S-box protein [Gammaproteobacteria bacterium]|nr:PAS domain S-box protein [Gammaproteobacteria bacterium]